ncbi:MAG TPA: hypothetical protein VK859_06400 [bacterium]|nr:hypothetical protein [bacterium]
MDIVNSEIKETAPVPESVPAPVASTPEVPAPPTAPPAPVTTATAAPAPAPAVPVVKGEIPKTTGKTPGGWNRFAGYNPNDAKNKKNDRRGDSSKGRR